MVLSLQTGGGDSFDEIFLGQGEDDHRRQHGHDRHRQHLVPIDGGTDIDGDAQSQRQRILTDTADVDQLVEKVIPAPDELEERHREQGRLAQRHQDPGHDLERIATVDNRRFVEFLGDAPDELDQHEYEKRLAGEKRGHEKRQVAVEPAQVLK